jgi:hypothetical protein
MPKITQATNPPSQLMLGTEYQTIATGGNLSVAKLTWVGIFII